MSGVPSENDVGVGTYNTQWNLNQTQNYPELFVNVACKIVNMSTTMPSAMVGVCNTHEHNAHNVTSLMLSGLRGRYVPEWFDIYTAIATHIDVMFSERNKLIDNKMNQGMAKFMTDYWVTNRGKSRAMPLCCRCSSLNKWYRLNDWWYWILYICYLIKKYFLISIAFVFLFFMHSPTKAVIKTYITHCDDIIRTKY